MPSDLVSALGREGFAFVHGDRMRELLAMSGGLEDWDSFAASWNALQLDTYMADGGRYRRRRHAVFGARPGSDIERQPHQPHYQALEYNPVHGGIARWFEPVAPQVADGATLQTVLAFCRQLFEALAGGVRPWRIEIHQFRIEARGREAGRPTPEGLHRDGVDYVLVLLVNRRNIASGTTSIHALDGRTLGEFTLTDPLDAALVDDRRVAHGVTPVEAIESSQPAFRDVLVVTFKADPSTLQDPLRTLQDPLSTLQDPLSTLQDPSSTLQDPRTTLHDPASTLHDPPKEAGSRSGGRGRSLRTATTRRL